MALIKFVLALIIFVIAFAVGSSFPAHHSPSPKNVAYVTEEEGGISVIDLNSLRVIRRIDLGDLAPRGLVVTHDGKYLVTANKNTGDIAIFDTSSLNLIRRVHVGENPEFVKTDPSGRRLFVTHEPGSSGGPPSQRKVNADNAKAEDDENGPPSEVATFHVGNWAPGPIFTAGQETESIEFSHDGKLMLVANEVQDTIGVFDKATGQHIRDVDLKSYGTRPRGLKISPLGNEYAVTMESSGTLLLLDSNLSVKKAVPTGAKPYGVAFDRAGTRIFVAAALARKLQVFSAASLQLLAEIPTEQRCWHFTFTPDDSKILLACGRSGNIAVVDALNYKQLQTITGLKLPWGIVTYPSSYGSLGLP